MDGIITKKMGHKNLSKKYFLFCIVLHNFQFLNRITPGVSDQRLLPGGGGSLGPRSYFQLIWTPFWTCGTIIEQLIVKGVHQ